MIPVSQEKSLLWLHYVATQGQTVKAWQCM